MDIKNKYGKSKNQSKNILSAANLHGFSSKLDKLQAILKTAC
jgi:hypothetical protein